VLLLEVLLLEVLWLEVLWLPVKVISPSMEPECHQSTNNSAHPPQQCIAARDLAWEGDKALLVLIAA
jgi:hypothetical protein